MQFPEWVDDPKLSDQDRARNRLRYLFQTIALDVTGSSTMLAFAHIAGVHRANLAYALNKGRCGELLARRIEENIQHALAKRELFRAPLEIKTKKAVAA